MKVYDRVVVVAGEHVGCRGLVVMTGDDPKGWFVGLLPGYVRVMLDQDHVLNMPVTAVTLEDA